MADKWRFLEWLARAEIIHTIIQSDFVRSLIWPFLMTAVTGGTGLLDHIPLMWIAMASCVAFFGTSGGLLSASIYRERRNPHNKLMFVGTYLNVDLTPTRMPYQGNRKQRLSKAATKEERPMLGNTQIVAGVPRTLTTAQPAVEIRNTAAFPISLFLEKAETELVNLHPPRSAFPKPTITLLPGSTIRIMDDAIDMKLQPCGRIAGRMDLMIRYGLPKKEKYELHLKANLDIQMTDFGFVSAVGTEWIQ